MNGIDTPETGDFLTPRFNGAIHLAKLPRTEKAVSEILSLPIYGEPPLEDVDYVCDYIAEFYGKK